MDWYQTNSGERLAALQIEEDENPSTELHYWRTYFQALVESLPGIQVRYPDIIFKDHFVIHGTSRSAQIFTYKYGHTSDDAILYLPDDGIIFMGDLLFKEFHPFLSESQPNSAISILEEIMDFEAEIFIPGHGTVATIRDILKMRDYIVDCMELARECHDQSKPETALDDIEIPAAYSDWFFRNFFYGNLHHCYRLINE